MNYSIETLTDAKNDFTRFFTYIAERSPQGAASWANAFDRTIQSLKTLPLACSLAPEDEDHDAEIRQLFFCTRHGLTYRALITVTGSTVYVLHIRGPGQDVMSAADVVLPDQQGT
jgi:plasmid stabilization system protein ParE